MKLVLFVLKNIEVLVVYINIICDKFICPLKNLNKCDGQREGQGHLRSPENGPWSLASHGDRNEFLEPDNNGRDNKVLAC